MAHLGFRVVSVNREPDMDQEWCYAYSRNCQKKGPPDLQKPPVSFSYRLYSVV